MSDTDRNEIIFEILTLFSSMNDDNKALFTDFAARLDNEHNREAS